MSIPPYMYNKDDKTESAGARKMWSIAEIDHMAELEIAYGNSPVTSLPLQQYLANDLGRTVYAI